MRIIFAALSFLIFASLAHAALAGQEFAAAVNADTAAEDHRHQGYGNNYRSHGYYSPAADEAPSNLSTIVTEEEDPEASGGTWDYRLDSRGLFFR